MLQITAAIVERRVKEYIYQPNKHVSARLTSGVKYRYPPKRRNYRPILSSGTVDVLL
jgi:hypothetical protein